MGAILVFIIIGLGIVGMLTGLYIIDKSGPGEKFTLKRFNAAEDVIEGFKKRAFEVSKILSSEIDVWDRCIGFDYDEIADDMHFQIIPATDTEPNMVMASFDAGYEDYDGEVFIHIAFPFSLLNASDDKIRCKYKVVPINQKFMPGGRRNVFEAVEKTDFHHPEASHD